MYTYIIYETIPPTIYPFLHCNMVLCFPNTAGTAGGTATGGKAAAAVAREALDPGATEFKSSWKQAIHVGFISGPMVYLRFILTFFGGWGYYCRHLVYVCVGYEYMYII